jgi:uracil-DNA glycosylase
MGLSFSVPSGEMLPPSLKNIYKELENDLGLHMKNDGDLSYLGRQGVLLINAYLSVRKNQPLSHHCEEYDLFMKDLFEYMDKLDQPIVFMLWGGFARKHKKYITNKKHIVLESVHPSPLGANHGGWFNLHQFSRCNNFLLENGVKPIDWQN